MAAHVECQWCQLVVRVVRGRRVYVDTAVYLRSAVCSLARRTSAVYYCARLKSAVYSFAGRASAVALCWISLCNTQAIVVLSVSNTFHFKLVALCLLHETGECPFAVVGLLEIENTRRLTGAPRQ